MRLWLLVGGAGEPYPQPNDQTALTAAPNVLNLF